MNVYGGVLAFEVSFFYFELRISESRRDTISVGKNNLLLRGCIIRNTDWVEGMVVYAGLYPLYVSCTLDSCCEKFKFSSS